MLLRVVLGMCPVLGRVMQFRIFGVRCAVLCFVLLSGHMLLRVVFGMCFVLGYHNLLSFGCIVFERQVRSCSSRGTCYYESYLACVLCWDGSCNSASSECGVLSFVLFSYRGTCYYESYLACVLCWDVITCLALAASCCQKSRALGGKLKHPTYNKARPSAIRVRVNSM